MSNLLRFCVFLFAMATTPMAASAANCIVPNSITKVQNARVGTWEFVDFWLKAPVTATRTITAATPPFIEDGSGNTIVVAGNHWTKVTFNSVDWMCSTPTFLSLPKQIVKAIKQTGRFEGTISYVVGRQNHNFMGSSWTTIGSSKRLRLKFH